MNSEKPEHANIGWSRRDKLRLTGMIAALGFVLYAIYWSAQPEHWHWIAPPKPPETENATSAIDTETNDSQTEGNSVHVSQEGGKTPAQLQNKATEDGTAVDPLLLESVQDNTLGVRRVEADAFYALLARVHDAPPTGRSTKARDEVAYKVLMSDPAHYRGKPVTVSGNVRRLNELPVEENPETAGAIFDHLYEAWIFTPDSGNNPIRVVSTSIPDGMPLGESERLRVRVTGYFFKLQGYEAQSGLHTAPLLLAASLTQLPASHSSMGTSSTLNTLMTVGLIFIALAFGYVRWQMRYNRSRPGRHSVRPGRTEHTREPLPEKIEIPADIAPTKNLEVTAGTTPHTKPDADGSDGTAETAE